MRRNAIRLDTNAVAQIALRRYLLTLKDRSQNFYPAWDAVLDILYKAQSQLFEREGKTSEHGKWAKLSPRYKAWKKKHYPGQPRLELTGQFWIDMTRPSGQHIEIRQPRRLIWGSDHPVSGGHDLGGIHAVGRGAGGAIGTVTEGIKQLRTVSAIEHTSYMPAREPIRITQRNVNDIADTAVDYLLDFDLSRPRQAWEISY